MSERSSVDGTAEQFSLSLYRAAHYSTTHRALEVSIAWWARTKDILLLRYRWYLLRKAPALKLPAVPADPLQGRLECTKITCSLPLRVAAKYSHEQVMRLILALPGKLTRPLRREVHRSIFLSCVTKKSTGRCKSLFLPKLNLRRSGVSFLNT